VRAGSFKPKQLETGGDRKKRRTKGGNVTRMGEYIEGVQTAELRRKVRIFGELQKGKM